jgi:hypothetical protein
VKRIALALAAVLCALPAAAVPKAQYVWLSAVDPFTCNAMQEGAIYHNTTNHKYYYCNASAWTEVGAGSLSGTINTLAKFTSSSTIGNSSITDNGTTVTVPNSGHVGASDTTSLTVTNTNTATGINYGISATAVPGSASGTQVGGFFQGAGADPAKFAYGIWAQANTGVSAASSVGVLGDATSGNVRIGGMFSVNILSFTPTLPATVTQSDVVLTHPSFSADYLTATTDTSRVFRVIDGGALWIGQSKALTDAAAAVAFAILTVPSGSATGGQFDYCIEVIDTAGTPDRQNRCGGLVYTAVNKGGTLTITCARPSGSTTLDNTTDTIAASSGTMTDTFTCVDGGSGLLNFKVTADSSLTVATERINYSLRQWGNASVTFTPQ